MTLSDLNVPKLTLLATEKAHSFSTTEPCKILETNLAGLELQPGHTHIRNGLLTGFAAGFSEGYRYANALLVAHVSDEAVEAELQPQESAPTVQETQKPETVVKKGRKRAKRADPQ